MRGRTSTELVKLPELALHVARHPIAAAATDQAEELFDREDRVFLPSSGSPVVAALVHLLGSEPGSELPEGDVAFLVEPPGQRELMRVDRPVASFDGVGVVPRRRCSALLIG